MKPFNFTQYIKDNPLLKESINEAEAMPAEAHQLVSQVEQALENKSIDSEDIIVSEVTEDSAKVNIDLKALGITVITKLDVIKEPSAPEKEGPYTFYGGSDGEVDVKPDRIEVGYTEDKDYIGEDTTRIVELLNKNYYRSVIEVINHEWNLVVGGD